LSLGIIGGEKLAEGGFSKSNGMKTSGARWDDGTRERHRKEKERQLREGIPM